MQIDGKEKEVLEKNASLTSKIKMIYIRISLVYNRQSKVQLEKMILINLFLTTNLMKADGCHLLKI